MQYKDQNKKKKNTILISLFTVVIHYDSLSMVVSKGTKRQINKN